MLCASDYVYLKLNQRPVKRPKVDSSIVVGEKKTKTKTESICVSALAVRNAGTLNYYTTGVIARRVKIESTVVQLTAGSLPKLCPFEQETSESFLLHQKHAQYK